MSGIFIFPNRINSFLSLLFYHHSHLKYVFTSSSLRLRLYPSPLSSFFLTICTSLIGLTAHIVRRLYLCLSDENLITTSLGGKINCLCIYVTHNRTSTKHLKAYLSVTSSENCDIFY